MRILTTYALILAITASPGLAVGNDSQGPQSSDSSSQPYQLKNVELSSDGSMTGQFVTSAGLPLGDASLSVKLKDGKKTVKTDDNGRFSVTDLKPGQCVISCGSETFACRLWANGTAPPKSIQQIAIVASKGAEVRGNVLWPPPYIPVPSRLAAISAKQALGLGIVAAGATVGIIAVTDDDDDAS